MNFKSTLLMLCAFGVLTSCKKNGSDSIPESPGNYILTVTPAATTGVADYLLTSSTLESGSVSTKGNGVEQDGTYRYYVTTNGKFFSMLYGQGNPGAVTAYNIVDGKLNKLTNFQTETVQAFAPFNKDLFLLKISRSLTAPTSSWYKVDTDGLKITSEGTFNSLDMTGVGELAHFTWVKQVGTKLFAPYQTIADRSFNTKYPNTASIAIFNYADMKLDKIITDNRTSFIGKYFLDGLSVEESGDVYAFSPACATSATTVNGTATSVISTTVPSGILKIKSGTTEFDKDYFFNFETASGGLNIVNWIYVGGSNYVVFTQTKAEKSGFPAGKAVGVINTVNKTFKAVTGMPSVDNIATLTTTNYTPKDGKTAYFGVNMKDGTAFIYKVDVSTAVATKGLTVEGGTVTAVQKL